jgi:hypothetical protein
MKTKRIKEAIGGGPANFPNYDARTGLGYGTQSGYHDQRQYQGSYPYKEPPSELEQLANDEEYDEEFDHKVSKKISAYAPTDGLATKKNDPFYFFGAATRFESIARNQTKGSISPIPDLYANRDSGMIGSNTWQNTKNVLRTRSTPYGTEKSSILLDPSDEQAEDPTISHLRELIRAIFIANNHEK